MSWFMCAWSLTTMLLMSEKKYKIAWTSSFLSQFGWAYVAWVANLPGMLVFSAVMLVVAGRGLHKAVATPTTTTSPLTRPGMKHLYGCPYFPEHRGDPYFCACDKAREQFAKEDAEVTA